MPRIGITVLFMLLSINARAEENNLIDLAHKAGFNSCDTAINTEFKALSEQGNGVVSTGYFNKRSFSVMASWGQKNDSVWKNTTFVKFGRRCLAYSTIGSTSPESCASYQQKNTQWNVIQEQADFIWTQNEGGVSALMKNLAGGGCSLTYRVHQSYDIKGKTRIKKKAEKKKVGKKVASQ